MSRRDSRSADVHFSTSFFGAPDARGVLSNCEYTILDMFRRKNFSEQCGFHVSTRLALRRCPFFNFIFRRSRCSGRTQQLRIHNTRHVSTKKFFGTMWFSCLDATRAPPMSIFQLHFSALPMLGAYSAIAN